MLNSKTYPKLIHDFQKKCFEKIPAIQKTALEISIIGSESKKFFKKIHKQKTIDNDTFFWLTQIVFLIDVLENLYSENEEELFDLFDESSYRSVFYSHLKKNNHIFESSFESALFIAQDLENLLLGNILQKPCTITSSYMPRPEFGDSKTSFGKSKQIKVEGTSLWLRGKYKKEFLSRLKWAHDQIALHSASSFTRLNYFTQVIVPYNDPCVVSYSSQDLPGVSMINLYNRDRIDLMDDLLHENGHHHLNYYLNLGKLITENPEQIYYSPWRKAPRPVRGIYHAYMTFFWAAHLFFDLYQASSSDFTKEEKKKIKKRLIEEISMLLYCEEEMNKIFNNKLMTQKGYKLYQELSAKVHSYYLVLPFKKEIDKKIQKLKLVGKNLIA